MSYPIIVVCGNAHSGKDTLVASVTSPRVFKTSFAAPIKEFLVQVGVKRENLYGPSNLRSEKINLPRLDYLDVNYSTLSVLNMQSNVGACYQVLDFLNKNPTCRDALRFIGDTVRTHSRDFFAKKAIESCKTALYSGNYDLAIISDGRFRNEVLSVKELGGRAYLVKSDMAVPDEHQSEAELLKMPTDWFTVINNNKGELALAADQFKEGLLVIYGID